MPALLIRISIAPEFFSIASTPSLAACATVTSKPATDTLCPAAASLAAAASSLPASRPLRTTSAPCSARPCASANPMPCEEPVTSALLPVSSNSSNAMQRSRDASSRKGSSPQRLLDTVQSEAEEGVGMHIEELHALFEPIRQLVGRHQRPGDLARGANLVDDKADLVDDGLRPRLAEGRCRRISHILRQVTGPDEEHVDPFNREQFVDIVDGLQRLDHGDVQSLFVIG